MAPLVKLVGSGISLASEALAARQQIKQRSRPPGPSAPATDCGNRAPPAFDSLDPSSTDYGLIEVANEHDARQLIDQGKAVAAGASSEVNQDDSEGQNAGVEVEICRSEPSG
ncbi:MAG: hypothetical protein Q9175_000922 [Cornicularia normoerica]